MSLRPEVMDLMKATGGGRYGRVYAAGYGPVGGGYSGGCGAGLVGGGLVGGRITGGGLPRALKAELYATDPAYAARVDKARARGGPPVPPKGSEEAKRRGEAAKATRQANAAAAARRTLDQDIANGGLASLQQLNEMYCVNKSQIAAAARKAKAAQYRAGVKAYREMGGEEKKHAGPPIVRGSRPAEQGEEAYLQELAQHFGGPASPQPASRASVVPRPGRGYVSKVAPRTRR